LRRQRDEALVLALLARLHPRELRAPRVERVLHSCLAPAQRADPRMVSGCGSRGR
jgi:hypothetical protein